MEVRSKAKFLKVPSKKLRDVADLIRGKNINLALNILKVTNRKASYFINQALKNVIANAQNKNDKVDVDKLYIKEIFVDEGPMSKRWMPRAMGRATTIRKRTSHLTVKVDEQEGE